MASTPSAAGGNADLSTATYSQSHTLTVGSRGNSFGAWISFDGTKIYTTHLITSPSRQHYISQYNFGTAFDVSTIGTIVGEKQITASIPDYLTGVVANLDNTWINYDPYSTNNYYSQPFGTAGDITTLGSVSTDTCSRSGGDRVSTSQNMSKDGNYLFLLSFSTHRRISLSTAGDLSSGSGCGTANATSGIASDMGDSYIQSIQFNNDGTRMYAGGRGSKIGQYDLSTAWDITSRGSVTTYDFSSDIGSSKYINQIQFNTDYTKMLIYDDTDKEIHEFDL